jgi:branched-chain amino acid transport system substrate-binding protein
MMGKSSSLKVVLVPLLLAIAISVSLAACGGGSSSSSSSTAPSGGGTTASSETPTGSPIVTLTYTDVDTEGSSFKNLEETVRVYEEWINANGGIAGRPLEAKFCDAKGTSTGTGACAREAVSDHAVAVVGNIGLHGDAAIPTLESAGIAEFGNCCATSPGEFSSKISLPIGSQPLFAVGLVEKAVQQECKSINAVLVEGAEAFEPVIEGAAKSLGSNVNKFVTLPAVAQDYSPQVAEATSGNADCIITIMPETFITPWLTAYSQAGATARLYAAFGELNAANASEFSETTKGDVTAGSYPDLSLPQWKTYREALKDYNADTSLNYDTAGGLGTWVAFEAFKQIVEHMEGSVDNKTFLAAADKAKVELPGLIPPINFAKPWGSDGGPEGFERLSNRCGTFAEFNGKQFVPLGDEFRDWSELAGGTKPMDCGEPWQ